MCKFKVRVRTKEIKQRRRERERSERRKEERRGVGRIFRSYKAVIYRFV